MKLKDVREAYYFYTGKTSDIIRYLGLAGIGIIWIFRMESGDDISIPRILLLPTILLVIGLGLDLLQYVAGSIIWGSYNSIKEKSRIGVEEEFEAPRPINWITDILFWLKIVPVTCAYILILKFLFYKLFA
jgi:hypothetical protein